MQKLSLRFTLSGFFPRAHPSNEENVDYGNSCRRITCHICHKKGLEWNSLEFCPYCNYIADYWQHGNSEVEKFLKSYGLFRIEKEWLEACAHEALLSIGLEPEGYTFSLKEDCRLLKSLEQANPAS